MRRPIFICFIASVDAVSVAYLPVEVWAALTAIFGLWSAWLYRNEAIAAWRKWSIAAPWGRRTDTPEQAVRENPGDGMAVARLIMQAPTLAKVEELYAAFDASPYKGTEEGQVHVAAARRIRHARAEGVTRIPWESGRAAEELAMRFGREEYRSAVVNLVMEFPEAGKSWYE